MVKTDFFSSPAYRVPPIRIVRCAKWMTMNVPDWVPCSAGSACISGACSTVQDGAKVARPDGGGRRNALYTNRAHHAIGVTKRMPKRGVGTAPAHGART